MAMRRSGSKGVGIPSIQLWPQQVQSTRVPPRAASCIGTSCRVVQEGHLTIIECFLKNSMLCALRLHLFSLVVNASLKLGWFNGDLSEGRSTGAAA